VREEHGCVTAVIHLCDSWSATPLAASDIINIVMARDHAAANMVLGETCSLPPPPAVTRIGDDNGKGHLRNNA
jgi:hypothetical protein